MAQATLTWYGTNSWLLETPRAAVLVDPFVQLAGAENPNSVHDFVSVGCKRNVHDILITHCHFDHLASTPAILRELPALVYCTECGVTALREDGCPLDTVITVAPGLEFDIEDIHVSVLAGRHIKFDPKLVAETLAPQHLATERENIPLIMHYMGIYKEAGETVIYDVQANGVHIQFLGSLALHPGEDYPAGADYLVLPYQGNSHLPDKARKIIKRLEPHNILASHFDNAFPPISATVDLSGLQDIVAHEFPAVRLQIPNIGRPIALTHS